MRVDPNDRYYVFRVRMEYRRNEANKRAMRKPFHGKRYIRGGENIDSKYLRFFKHGMEKKE